MKSIIKFLLFFLAVVLVITWLVTIYKSGNNEMEPTESQMDNQELMDNSDDMQEDVLEVMNEDELDEEYQTILEDTEYNDKDDNEDEFNYQDDAIEEEDEAIVEEEDVVDEIIEEETTTTRDNYTSNDASAREVKPYMVIVGSFLVPDNANKKKKVINEMGFNGEVVNFDLSQYHTVLAGRYNSNAEAQLAVKKLKEKGIDAYAKKREE